MRTLARTGTVALAPTGRTSRYSRTRRSFAWAERGSSPISSRNSVPSSAASKSPRRLACAPEKAPRSCPKSSLSRSSGFSSATLTGSMSRRPLRACRARATSSFPVPVSPQIRIGSLNGARCSIRSYTRRIARVPPRIPSSAAGLIRSRSISTAIRRSATRAGSQDAGVITSAVPHCSSARTYSALACETQAMISGRPGRAREARHRLHAVRGAHPGQEDEHGAGAGERAGHSSPALGQGRHLDGDVLDLEGAAEAFAIEAPRGEDDASASHGW